MANATLHDSAELTCAKGGKQQAAAPNARYQSHFASRGESRGPKKANAWVRILLERRKDGPEIWIAFLLSLNAPCPDPPSL